jgi:glycosyltransferase involved in cell wall biosynthesis
MLTGDGPYEPPDSAVADDGFVASTAPGPETVALGISEWFDDIGDVVLRQRVERHVLACRRPRESRRRPCVQDRARDRQNADRGRRASQPDRDFRWALAGDTAVYPDHEGAAVFTRPDQARATHALAMKTQGARVVAETDDNYFAPRNQNIAMRMRFDDDSARLYRNALATFDALVTTTVALRDQIWDALEKKQRRRMEFHVVGNHIDPDDWPEPVPRDGPIRVGWMGSDSHFRDVKLIYPALAWAARNGCEVVLIGYDPRWHPQCAVDGISGLSYGDEFGFPHRQIPWVDPQQYGRDKAVYPLDIALAPLEVTAFNLGKSDVKALEYGMSGAAVVAQNMPVYQTLRHGDTGFLAGSPAEFLYWTQQLVTNERLRRESADALQAYIREERLIEHHAGEWREAITGC